MKLEFSSQIFEKFKYQIWWRSVQWDTRCPCGHTDREIYGEFLFWTPSCITYTLVYQLQFIQLLFYYITWAYGYMFRPLEVVIIIRWNIKFYVKKSVALMPVNVLLYTTKLVTFSKFANALKTENGLTCNLSAKSKIQFR